MVEVEVEEVLQAGKGVKGVMKVGWLVEGLDFLVPRCWDLLLGKREAGQVVPLRPPAIASTRGARLEDLVCKNGGCKGSCLEKEEKVWLQGGGRKR